MELAVELASPPSPLFSLSLGLFPSWIIFRCVFSSSSSSSIASLRFSAAEPSVEAKGEAPHSVVDLHETTRERSAVPSRPVFCFYHIVSYRSPCVASLIERFRVPIGVLVWPSVLTLGPDHILEYRTSCCGRGNLRKEDGGHDHGADWRRRGRGCCE